MSGLYRIQRGCGKIEVIEVQSNLRGVRKGRGEFSAIESSG
jgi:hypothetical protein